MKEIENFDGYFVTTSGEIYSNKRGSLKKRKTFIDSSKYKRIQLRNNQGNLKNLLVHRLVALTFIPNDNHTLEVNHKNGDKLDNRVENLEWLSRSDNLKHAFENNLKTCSGSSNSRSILSEKQVLEIYSNLLQGSRVVDQARLYGVTNGTINSIKYKDNWNFLLKHLPNIPVRGKRKKLSKESVMWVCSKLESGLAPIQIQRKSKSNISIDQIYDIKRRICHKNISINYNW